MDIKVTKDNVEYTFKHSVDRVNAGRTKEKIITFHKWTCDKLTFGHEPAEVFYGVDKMDPKAKSAEDFAKQAEIDIKKKL